MTDDIVTRLRKKLVMEPLGDKDTYLTSGDCLDAADEIERLRWELELAIKWRDNYRAVIEYLQERLGISG